jgi:hypothetical protein
MELFRTVEGFLLSSFFIAKTSRFVSFLPGFVAKNISAFLFSVPLPGKKARLDNFPKETGVYLCIMFNL